MATENTLLASRVCPGIRYTTICLDCAQIVMVGYGYLFHVHPTYTLGEADSEIERRLEGRERGGGRSQTVEMEFIYIFP